MSEIPSELESLVLGIVWKKGPCTAHAVRTEFTSSGSVRFSGSAGSIYPLVKRLEARGLLLATPDTSTKQRKSLYEITPEGESALRGWVAPPLDESVFGVQYDPLRTRLYFLGILSPDQQSALLDQAEAGYREQLDKLHQTRDAYQEKDWRFSVLATEGIVLQMRAQLQWLRRVRRALEGGDVGSHGVG